MLELLLGIGIGAMVFTAQGREIGNKIGDSAIAAAKRMMKDATENEPTERATGTAGDNCPDC